MNKFLAQGEKEFFFAVKDGFAYRPSYSGAFVSISQTDLADGYYNQDNQDVKENVVGQLREQLEAEVNYYGLTLEKYITAVVSALKRKSIPRLEISDYPNVTKVLAQNLAKIFECATFVIDGNNLRFACFGAREEVVNKLDKYIMVNPEYLYYANIKDNTLAYVTSSESLIIYDELLSQITIIAAIDRNDRLNFLRKL